ncbi:MAG TPA: HD domain-containing protein [Gemmataceae bacterium]|jgi:phosphonate degradation associated HDIG domain protein|nr:HD domain-containing protein [Gemmataceae bacterium]
MGVVQAGSSRAPVADEVTRLFRERGNSNYGQEPVTQQQHALQAAFFAEREQAGPALIAAALLHDVGHLLHDLSEDAPNHGTDDRHEHLAAQWLRQRFSAGVVEPVALHVEAKRYLCAVDADYESELSPASQLSLRLQGGPMAAPDIRRFEEHPFFRAAVRLRRWDDAAKIIGLATPPLEHFVRYIDAAGLGSA